MENDEEEEEEEEEQDGEEVEVEADAVGQSMTRASMSHRVEGGGARLALSICGVATGGVNSESSAESRASLSRRARLLLLLRPLCFLELIEVHGFLNDPPSRESSDFSVETWFLRFIVVRRSWKCVNRNALKNIIQGVVQLEESNATNHHPAHRYAVNHPRDRRYFRFRYCSLEILLHPLPTMTTTTMMVAVTKTTRSSFQPSS